LSAQSSTPGSAFSINLDHLDSLIADTIKKVNSAKHDKQRRDGATAALEDKFKQLAIDERAASQFQGGESAEAQRLRELENSLDKVSAGIAFHNINSSLILFSVYTCFLEVGSDRDCSFLRRPSRFRRPSILAMLTVRSFRSYKKSVFSSTTR
jgi:hypothetical protein